jgi:hypothetical protein
MLCDPEGMLGPKRKVTNHRLILRAVGEILKIPESTPERKRDFFLKVENIIYFRKSPFHRSQIFSSQKAFKRVWR